MAHPRRAGCGAGFTLVELLSVIAIILLLLSLLAPLLSVGRERANVALCAANAHHLAASTVLYVADHEGVFPGVNWNPADFAIFWMEVTRPYHGQDDRIRHCPSARKQLGLFPQSYDTYWSGQYYGVSWMNNGTRWHEGGYALNGWLYSTHGASSTIGNPNYYATVQNVRKPAATPMFADCDWVDGWPEEWEHLTPGLCGVGGNVPGGSIHTARFGIQRHGLAINMAFVDGHIQKVPLVDLHQYLWKPSWTPHPLALP